MSRAARDMGSSIDRRIVPYFARPSIPLGGAGVGETPRGRTVDYVPSVSLLGDAAHDEGTVR